LSSSFVIVSSEVFLHDDCAVLCYGPVSVHVSVITQTTL